MANLLEINNLTIEFSSERGAARAVDGISLHLDRGETLGIVGESGSGKSVTALSVMRLLPNTGRATSGEILFYQPATNNEQRTTNNQQPTSFPSPKPPSANTEAPKSP